MTRPTHAVLVGAVVWAAGLVAGCGDDSAPADASIDAFVFEDVGPPPDAPLVPTDAAGVDAPLVDAGPCDPLWIVESSGGPDVIATIEGGALVVSARDIAAAATPISVYQTGLSGDFEGGFFYEMFDASAPGAFAQAAVGLGLPDYAVAGIGTVPVVGVGAAVFHPGMSPPSMSVPSAATSGYMRFKRTGTTLDVTVGAGADTAMVSDTLVGDDLRIGIQVGNSGADPAGGVTSVRITEFRMSGGGGVVMADSFDCDTLLH